MSRVPAGQSRPGRANAGTPPVPGHVAYVLGTSAGGTGEHVVMLARGCAARGIAVTVYGPARTGDRFFAPGGARVARPAGRRLRAGDVGFVPVEIADRPRPVRDLLAVARLRRALRRAGPDLVHAHGLRGGALAALAITGRGRRPPLLVTVHNAPVAGGVTGVVYGLLELIVARRADAVTAVSGDLVTRMRERGGRNVSRALVPAPGRPPPAAAEVAAVRREIGGAGRPVVLGAGRLAAQKGFALLVDAAGGWADREPVPMLVIAGAGPLDAQLRARAREAGLDARFLGHRTDVPALLAAADVVAVPSTWEGQPLLVAEALRAGRPIVAFRVGGIPDLTGDDGALLVTPGDVGALAAGVLAVLDEPGLAARLAAAARARAAALPSEQDAIAAAMGQYEKLLPARSEGRGAPRSPE